MKNLLKISFLCIFISGISFFAPSKANATTLVLDPIMVSGAGCYSLGMHVAGGVCVSPYVTVQMRTYNSTWQTFQGWTRTSVYQYTKGIKLGGHLWSAVQLAEMLGDLNGLAFEAAIKDIQYWREIGLHHPHLISPINWSSVNWDDHGAQNASLSNQDVLWNFVSWALNQ